jgi:dTDP-4-dehydrorhamnose reductase
MRILIIGGDGMLGHQCLRSWRMAHEVAVTLRKDYDAYEAFGMFDRRCSYAGVDVRSMDRLAEVFAAFRPEAVLNAVGIVKQRVEASAAIPSIELNSLLPHRLAVLCRTAGARLVHLSTDCVFSGHSGCYSEAESADADDLYGRSKYLGEVGEPGCITLRTSIIGRELSRKNGLLEWFLAQRGGTVRGFRRAIFSGFTTLEMARIIETLLVSHPTASGVYHVSAEPIAKFDLLTRVNTALRLGVTVVPDDDFCCDRSLDSTRFRREFDYVPPSWDAMIAELAISG